MLRSILKARRKMALDGAAVGRPSTVHLFKAVNCKMSRLSAIRGTNLKCSDEGTVDRRRKRIRLSRDCFFAKARTVMSNTPKDETRTTDQWPR